MMIREYVETMRVWVRSCGIPLTLIARKAGLHANTLLPTADPSWQPTPETLARLGELKEAIEEGANIDDLPDREVSRPRKRAARLAA